MIRDAKKILVINMRYIGDTVWMYPFIRNLKLGIPEAQITALVNEGGDLLKLMDEGNSPMPILSPFFIKNVPKAFKLFPNGIVILVFGPAYKGKYWMV